MPKISLQEKLPVTKRYVAEEVVNTENLVPKNILQGVHPLDAFHKHGRF